MCRHVCICMYAWALMLICAPLDVSMYGNAELIFCNVENIHVMRASAIALADALAMQQNMHASTKVPLLFVFDENC